MDPRNRYDSLIHFYCDREQLPFALIKAQMLAESAANPIAESHVGAMGLMQFMPATWNEVRGKRDRDPFNPEHSIELGCEYMHRLLTQFHDDDVALAAYNWGSGNIRKHLTAHTVLSRTHLPPETQQYLIRIGRMRSQFEGESV